MEARKGGNAMRWLAAITLLGVALGTLGGCAGAPRTYGETVRSAYSPTEFGYGAARRDLWTQMRPSPSTAIASTTGISG